MLAALLRDRGLIGVYPPLDRWAAAQPAGDDAARLTPPLFLLSRVPRDPENPLRRLLLALPDRDAALSVLRSLEPLALLAFDLPGRSLAQGMAPSAVVSDILAADPVAAEPVVNAAPTELGASAGMGVAGAVGTAEPDAPDRAGPAGLPG